MNSKSTNLVLVFLVFWILVLACLNFFILDQKSSLEKILSFFKPSLKISLPVSRDKLSTIPKLAEKSDHLIFFLEEGEPVYAAFDGKVSRFVPATEQLNADNIQLKAKSGNSVLSYLIFGESFVKEEETVKRGQLIGKAKQEQGPGVLGGANLGIYLFENEKLVPLSKEKLLQITGTKEE